MPRLGWIVVFLFFGFAVAMAQYRALPAPQKATPPKDIVIKDSLRIYKKIKRVAYRHKYTRMAYDAVFVDPEPKEYSTQPEKKEGENVNPYLKYQDKIIKSVKVIVHDPFGYSVTDTVLHPVNTMQRFGNKAHITTRKWVIINKLLFEENKLLDALSVSESERLLRASIYVNDAKIFVSGPEESDSVEVTVVVLDKWPVTVPFLITDISANARFRNDNLFGLGQQFQQYAGWRRSDNLLDYSGFYNIANLDNTYISANLGYDTNRDGTQVSLAFDRPFYSPLASWAGGAAAVKAWNVYRYKDTIDQSPRSLHLDYFSYDLWAAKSFKISRDTDLFNQSTNIIVGGRYYETDYQRRPPFSIDKGHSFQRSQAYVGNVGFSIQQFYKDKYIYRFGASEDVPEGLIVQWLYGAFKKEELRIRYYTGFEVARAKHFHFGYLSATYAYGVFFNTGTANDITMNGKLNYFTDLRKIGRWYLRQFVDFNIVHGENKLSNETVSLTADDMYGFSSGNVVGKTKMVLNLETVGYAPYNIIGFRLAPILMVGMGMLGSPQHRILNSQLYQAYSLGVMVRNENLLSSTFQVSFGYYPYIPGGGNNVLTYNPVTSFTLRVRVFSISKPAFVSY